jgi:hypothetical protein
MLMCKNHPYWGLIQRKNNEKGGKKHKKYEKIGTGKQC